MKNRTIIKPSAMGKTQALAAATRHERAEAAQILRGISAVMLAQTGETWPVLGALHTASVRSRALRTARMREVSV